MSKGHSHFQAVDNSNFSFLNRQKESGITCDSQAERMTCMLMEWLEPYMEKELDTVVELCEEKTSSYYEEIN